MSLVEAGMKTCVSELKPTCTSTSYWQSEREGWLWSTTDFFPVCFRGILSVSWCQADPELLLSSAKDNRILCWNPSTGEVLNSYKYTLSSSYKPVCYTMCLTPFLYLCGMPMLFPPLCLLHCSFLDKMTMLSICWLKTTSRDFLWCICVQKSWTQTLTKTLFKQIKSTLRSHTVFTMSICFFLQEY